MLTGGSTPARRVRAAPPSSDADWSGRDACGSPTSAACRPTTRTRTSGWPRRALLVPPLAGPPRVDAHRGRARRRGGGRRLRGAGARAPRHGPALRPRPARARARTRTPRRCSPASRSSRRPVASSRRPDRGHGAAGAAGDAHAARAQRAPARSTSWSPAPTRRRRSRARSASRRTRGARAALVRPGAASLFVSLDEAAAARAVMRRQFIGLDVGGTKIASATLQDGKLETQELIKTDVSDSDALVGQLVELIGHLRDDGHGRGRGRRCPRSSSSRPGAIAPQRQHPARRTCRCASC